MQDILTNLLQRCTSKNLTEKDIELIRVTLDSCFELPKEIEDIRPSSVAFKNCMKWGGTIENALASSLLTLNSQHGPFRECYRVIDTFLENNLDFTSLHAILYHDPKYRVPGFGNPVIKENDKRCENIETALNSIDTKYYVLKRKIEDVILETKGRDVRANLVFHVCSVSHYLGLPSDFSSILAVIGFQISYIHHNQTRVWPLPP